MVSDEDIRQYELNEIWDQYHPLRKGRYYFGSRPSWTIDRDRNIFLLPIGQGNREQGNVTRFLLWCSGSHVIVETALLEGSSAYFEESPFRRVWGLVSIETPKDSVLADEEVMQILKEAITTFGYDGARKQIPHTVVEFKF
jgi:hypothetical protein